MLGIVAQLLRGRPENKRRRGKHQEQSKKYGLAKGGSVAYGSPKKKDSVDNMSSREGAKVAGWGAAAGVVIVEESLEVVREGGAVRETG